MKRINSGLANLNQDDDDDDDDDINCIKSKRLKADDKNWRCL